MHDQRNETRVNELRHECLDGLGGRTGTLGTVALKIHKVCAQNKSHDTAAERFHVSATRTLNAEQQNGIDDRNGGGSHRRQGLCKRIILCPRAANLTV